MNSMRSLGATPCGVSTASAVNWLAGAPPDNPNRSRSEFSPVSRRHEIDRAKRRRVVFDAPVANGRPSNSARDCAPAAVAGRGAAPLARGHRSRCW